MRTYKLAMSAPLLSWLATLALCAIAAAADAAPSNTSTAFQGFSGTVQLQSNNPVTNLSELVPLTTAQRSNVSWELSIVPNKW